MPTELAAHRWGYGETSFYTSKMGNGAENEPCWRAMHLDTYPLAGGNYYLRPQGLCNRTLGTTTQMALRAVAHDTASASSDPKCIRHYIVCMAASKPVRSQWRLWQSYFVDRHLRPALHICAFKEVSDLFWRGSSSSQRTSSRV